MKLYIKQCRPYQVGLGSKDNWTPLEDWQSEDNETMLREKYKDNLDAWTELGFKYRYIVKENTIDKNDLIEQLELLQLQTDYVEVKSFKEMIKDRY